MKRRKRGIVINREEVSTQGERRWMMGWGPLSSHLRLSVKA